MCPLAPEVMDPVHTVKAKDSTTLLVTFNLQSGATSYIIRIQNSNGFFREDTVSTPGVSQAEIRSLMAYTEYELSIMSENSAGRSQPSLPATAKTSIVVCYITFISLHIFLPHSWKTKPYNSVENATAGCLNESHFYWGTRCVFPSVQRSFDLPYCPTSQPRHTVQRVNVCTQHPGKSRFILPQKWISVPQGLFPVHRQ